MVAQISLYEEGKIDVHNRKAKYQKALLGLSEDKSIVTTNRYLIARFLRDCALGKTVKGRAKKKIGAGRCLKYLGILRRLSVWFGMSFESVGQSDMEDLVHKLETDQLRKDNDKPYADATKADIKKTIKKFWKWKDGSSRVYPDLVEWIDTCDPVKEVSALRRKEVEQMIEAASTIRDRAVVMVLFDSGARAEEILNVRLKKEHLFWKESTGCYMIRLEFSKTRPRTISLPLATKHLSAWLTVHPEKDNALAQLFPVCPEFCVSDRFTLFRSFPRRGC